MTRPSIEDLVTAQVEDTVQHLRRGGSIALVSEPVRTFLSTWALSKGRPVACRAGCAACCNQDVACHPTEILVLASVLRRTRNRAQIKELVARLRTPRAKLEPCPLLSGEGLCTVYAARPLKCCGQHSLDALACQLDHGRHPVDQDQLEATDAPFMALIIAARRLGLEAGPVLLTAALAIALTLPDAEARWRRGERIFAGTEVELKIDTGKRTKLRVLP